MTLETDSPQLFETERIVHVLLAAVHPEDAPRIHTAMERFPSFQVRGARDFEEARALLESRTFHATIVGGSLADHKATAFLEWVGAERPEMAILRMTASGMISSADADGGRSGFEDPEGLASHITAAIRAAGSVRRRETMVRWLEQESRVDHLTGLYNRKLFYDRLTEACASARTPVDHVTLIVLDVVGTRMVNEAHGREAGDSMIQRAATGITRSVRGADFAARIDGDDFAVILPNADFELGQRVARRIAHELERLNDDEWQGQLPVEVSFGVATGTECTATELFAAAMDELSRCKNRSMVLSEFPHPDHPDGPSVA